MLIPKLLSMHYPCVLERLAQHVAKHPYPPTISEIAVYETKRNTQLETLKKWREEAAHVPVELKETFHKQMLHVIREKTDRKSTRLNSSHVAISYAVFCLKKKKKT